MNLDIIMISGDHVTLKYSFDLRNKGQFNTVFEAIWISILLWFLEITWLWRPQEWCWNTALISGIKDSLTQSLKRYESDTGLAAVLLEARLVPSLLQVFVARGFQGLEGFVHHLASVWHAAIYRLLSVYKTGRSSPGCWLADSSIILTDLVIILSNHP